jgi:hypothetical protein
LPADAQVELPADMGSRVAVDSMVVAAAVADSTVVAVVVVTQVAAAVIGKLN